MAGASSPIVLNSWKEIAGYLGRGVRTVQRYERESQLPVRRLRGKARVAVIAFPTELDNWLQCSAREISPLEHLYGWQALQNHKTAMSRLTCNLLTLREQVEEGRGIRTRRRWFGRDPAERIEEFETSQLQVKTSRRDLPTPATTPSQSPLYEISS